MGSVKGFTLLELIIVIVIVGLLGTAAVHGFSTFSAHASLESAAYQILRDISSVRMTGLKSDASVQVMFTGAGYDVSVDYNDDGVYQSGESVQSISLEPPLQFGLPSNPPVSAPPDASLPAGGVPAAGDWNSVGLLVANDAFGTVNEGSVYISSEKLSDVVFCLRVSKEKQNFKMYKWNGSSWIAL